MSFLSDSEIIYSICTGDAEQEEKMRLLRGYLKTIKRDVAVRISNKIIEECNEQYDTSKEEKSE